MEREAEAEAEEGAEAGVNADGETEPRDELGENDEAVAEAEAGSNPRLL